MNIKEATKELGISRATIDRYRKTLGIFEETKKNITHSHIEMMKNYKQEKGNYNEKKDIEDLKKEAFNFDAIGLLEINEKDSQKVKNLKNDYNTNRRFIEYMQNGMDNIIDDNKIPPKFIYEAIMQYQKLNIRIVSSLEKLEVKSSNLESLIIDSLSKYG